MYTHMQLSETYSEIQCFLYSFGHLCRLGCYQSSCASSVPGYLPMLEGQPPQQRSPRHLCHRRLLREHLLLMDIYHILVGLWSSMVIPGVRKLLGPWCLQSQSTWAILGLVRELLCCTWSLSLESAWLLLSSTILSIETPTWHSCDGAW